MGDETIIQEFIETMGKSMKPWGFAPILGEIWGTLYFKGEMTQEQLAKDMECSVSAISQALTQLQNMGSIKVTRKEGKKSFYSAEICMHDAVKKKMENVLMFHIQPLCNLLEAKEKDIKEKETKKKTKELKEKYLKVSSFLKIMLEVK